MFCASQLNIKNNKYKIYWLKVFLYSFLVRFFLLTRFYFFVSKKIINCTFYFMWSNLSLTIACDPCIDSLSVPVDLLSSKNAHTQRLRRYIFIKNKINKIRKARVNKIYDFKWVVWIEWWSKNKDCECHWRQIDDTFLLFFFTFFYDILIFTKMNLIFTIEMYKNIYRKSIYRKSNVTFWYTFFCF